MEVASYFEEDRIEADHWWFQGRRRLFERVLHRLGVPKSGEILDAGTSNGRNLRLLQEAGFANFRGLEISDDAIALCAAKGLGPIERGDVCAMPFSDCRFDFVMATDIIEHVDRDDLALAEIRRVLKPGAYCLLTVPAFVSLWGVQDDRSHHKRRYRRAPLLALARKAGLAPVTAYYFNYLLFPPIWVARKLLKAFVAEPRNEVMMNTRLLNLLLSGVFTFDVATAPLLRPPFGVSLLMVCRRPPGDDAAQSGRMD